MPCHVYRSEDGQIQVIACTRGSQVKRCKCGRKSTKLCDYKLTGSKLGKTCDEPLCDRCSTPADKNIDLCPVHARMAVKESVRP
jgi:hypothetical protein